MIKRVGPFSPTPPTAEGREGLAFELIALRQRCNQPCLCNEASIKIRTEGVQRAAGLWTRPHAGRVADSKLHGEEAPAVGTLLDFALSISSSDYSFVSFITNLVINQ